MIQFSKETDERRDAGPLECWCLHGAVGMAADWREFSKYAATTGISTRAVDLWRFLDCCPMPLPEFATALNADANGQVFRGNGRALLGYSMGGRLALHALLAAPHPWQAAVIVSAHPGLESSQDQAARRSADATWATRALTGNWQEFLTAWDAQPLLANTSIREPGVSSAMLQRRREIARSFVDWSLGAQQPLWDRLPTLDLPVLWIVGENDRKFRDLAERAVASMPRARLKVAPTAGHRVPWEAPAWFAAEVTHFLKSADS